MRRGAALVVSWVVGILEWPGSSGEAYAVNSNISATTCRNYKAEEAADIFYAPWGVFNQNTNSRYVICPIVRSPTSTNAVSVFVDGSTAAGSAISCTLYSYDINGQLLQGRGFTSPSGTTFDQFLSVQGVYWGTASLLCLLPGNETGVLYDIDVVQ